MKKVIFTLMVLTLSAPVCSAIIEVDTMSINGGHVSIGGATYELLPGDIAPIIMGEYQGSPACCSPDAALTSLAYYEFGFFGWAGIHTSQFDGLSNQALAPSAFVDTDNSSVHVDLSSWTWSFNGNNFHQGDSDIVGSYDVSTGAYNVSWSSMVSGGPFVGQTLDWNLTGVASVSAVPIPSAVWLFGSGLIGLIGLARRRKA